MFFSLKFFILFKKYLLCVCWDVLWSHSFQVCSQLLIKAFYGECFKVFRQVILTSVSPECSHLSSSARAAGTNYHELGAVNSSNVFPCRSGGRTSEIQVWAGFAPSGHWGRLPVLLSCFRWLPQPRALLCLSLQGLLRLLLRGLPSAMWTQALHVVRPTETRSPDSLLPSLRIIVALV